MDALSFDPMIGAVALVGTAVFALAGVVAWLYWQQTKLFTNMNSLVSAFSEVVQQLPQQRPVEPAPPPPEAEDDRASVDDEEDGQSEKVPAPEVVDGPPAPLDTDTLESKTKKELQDILTKRGIPFGKADSKTVLLSLLKATA
uniref:HeH/LEM domain-containing protein n=1 Tax=viral metagenome TaxID=1070528 RepID=A0A6C0AKC7_9ZZZZ